MGQLRNIVRSQTTNGLSQLGIDKKLENTNNATHPVNEPIGSEVQIKSSLIKIRNNVTIFPFKRNNDQFTITPVSLVFI